MPSLMDIGKSAINAQRQALNVTGQNIANVNTDGYRRRDADLKEVSGSQSELASKSAQIGLGVSLGEVRRAFNSYLAQSANSAESKFQSASNFVNSLERLENLILPNEGDLSSQLTNFFGKISDISANPGDLAPRAAALEQGSGLTNSFNVTAQVITELKGQLRQSIDEEVNALNRLTESLATVNSRLRASNIGSAPPNALLDERDRLVAQISKKALITVEYGSRSEANLSFGRFVEGPSLISGDKAIPVAVTHSELSGSIFQLGNGISFKSIDDGSVRGLSDSLTIIESTLEKLDNLAVRVVEELNALHINGIDYDGEKGKELFTAKQFTVDQPQTNSKELDVTLLQVPGKIDAMQEMQVIYSAATDQWTAKAADGTTVGKGRQEIDLGGMVLKVNSQAKNGDMLSVSRVRGEASRIDFLLLNGREFAAASNFVITPASTNTGSATLTSEIVEESTPNLDNILEITTNSISPVSFTEFRNGGVVGYIPAEVGSFELASFGQSPVIEYNFSPSQGLGSFNVVFGGTQYNFPSDETKDILSPVPDAGEPAFNLLSDKIAKYLNNGVIKSSSGHSLMDLGLHAAGFEGGLKIAGGSEFTSGAFTTQTGSTSSGVVRNGIDSSGFRVFTREGRQIAGQPISSAQASLLITDENGFQKNAVYRADYLNSFGGVGYRGAEITNLRPNGYHGLTSVTSIINDGNLSQLIQKNPALNSLDNQSIEITTSDGLVNSRIDLNAGASAKEVAYNLNRSLMEKGFIAEAQTIASLELEANASQNGAVQFSFELDDENLLAVSIDYSGKNLSPLVSKINQYFDKTGVRAELSNDGNRVLLIDDQGNDITLSNFSGSALKVNALDQTYKKLLSNDIALDQSTKVVGSVDLKSPREFTLKSSLGGMGLSTSNAMLSGGIGRTFSLAGTVTDFEWEISPDLLAPQSSPDGLRLSTSNAIFTLNAAMNGQNKDLNIELESSDLNQFSSADISKALVAKARAIGTVPSLQGSVFTTLPPEGSSMSVRVGGSTYDLIFRNGDFIINGPEEQRILTSLETVTGGYQVSLAVPNGTTSGETIEVLNDTDAAQFGLASSDIASQTILRGRSFEFEDTTGRSVTAGLTSGKKYLINSKGTTDFTTADTGNSLANATVGDIFLSDGGALTGTGKVKQVFTADGGTKVIGGNADFLNLLDVHALGDLNTGDVSSNWIIADNSGNTSLTIGQSYSLTHNGTAFQLNGVTLQAGIKLIAAGKEFEVVENGSANHKVGAIIELNLNSTGNLVDKNGVAISNSLGVIEHKGNSKRFDVNFGNSNATIIATNYRGSYEITSNNSNLQFLSADPSLGKVASLTIDSREEVPLISLVTAQSNGPISFLPSTGEKTSIAVTAGLTSGKKYLINSKGTTDFTTADTGNSLANATVGDIFLSDGGALTGTGKVKQVFTADGGTKVIGGNADFLNLLDVHALGDLNTGDVSSNWIIADNSGNTSLTIGQSYSLTHNGTAFQLNGVTLQAGIKLIAAGKEFEVVENGSANHKVGAIIELNLNSTGNLVDKNGVAISNSLGVIEHVDAAKELGFQAGTFDFEVTQDGFRVISKTSDVVDIELDAINLPGQILSMKELPPEDLIIFLENEGARRLGAKYELGDVMDQQNEERNYRVEMTDQNLGKIEIIDTDSGHSIATRFTSGVSEFDLGKFRLNLSGFADQGDYFEIGLNQSKAGDSRNAEAIVSLNRNTPERSSFQEEFRSIALAVGSQLVSGRMIEVSATSMRDAARVTEDELSGVNLDEEASRLMEQQQAYKAAAQILQTARQMFDTLVSIM